MSDKIKENEFDENKPFETGKVGFEENDNWEFEAKALTLENNEFEADAGLPEAKEDKKNEKAPEKQAPSTAKKSSVR